MTAIELKAVSKSFGSTPVLTDVDLGVEEGSLTAILGESGSGKTTMLRLIAGFERVDRGTIVLGGKVVDDGHRAVHAQQRGIGYVPQEGALFPHLTVGGNIAFGLRHKDRAWVKELVELVGLHGMGRRYPHQLSGGQQQRVALARALAIRPKVVLLDEPFSSLDAALRVDLRRDVADILAGTGTTAVLVTHDQDEAMSLADTIAVLRRGEVVAVEHPRQLYRDPPDLEAATYVGEANVLPARREGRTAVGILGPVPLLDPPEPEGGALRLLLRPEQLVLAADRSPDGEAVGAAGAMATVTDLQYFGHDALVTVVLAGDGDQEQRLICRVPGDQELVPGSRVRVAVRGPARAWPA